MLEIHRRCQFGTERQLCIILCHITDVTDQKSREIFITDIGSDHLITLDNR